MSYESQCVAAVQIPGGDVKRCDRQSQPPSDPAYLTLIPICSWHLTKATRQFAGRIEDELEDLRREVADHECDGEQAVRNYMHETLDRHLRKTARRRESSMAYFIRCGQFIKIGASSSPLGRLHTIRNTGGVLAPRGLDLESAALVVTEPGGFEREKELHTRFAHLRAVGEWFTEAPELTAYIHSLTNEAAA
jgi:hypothetical protein